MQAGLFSAIHGVVSYLISPTMIGAFISAFVFGIVAYWAFYYVGSIFCPIAMHYTYNIIVIMWALGAAFTSVHLAILSLLAAIMIIAIWIVMNREELF